jgi:hypothetical protein
MAQSGGKIWNPGFGGVNQDMVVLAMDAEEADKILDVLTRVEVDWNGYQFGDAVLDFIHLLDHLADKESDLSPDAMREVEKS